MTQNMFSKQLKGLVADFVTEDGEIRESPIGNTGKRNLDSRKIRFLRSFLDLLLNSNFISDPTKCYIGNKYFTYKAVKEEFERKGIEKSESSIQSAIDYDLREKVGKCLGRDFITELLFYENGNLDSLEQKLTELMTKYADISTFKNIALRMPETSIKYSVSDEEFDFFITTILPYLRTHMAEISQSLSTDVVGYIKYIMSNSTLLNEVDKERKDRLKLLLSYDKYTDTEGDIGIGDK